MSKPNISWRKKDLLEYIELNIKNYKALEETYERTVKINVKLAKALDKACEELDMLTQEFVPASNYPHITKEDELDRIDQWEEWCMKDE